MGFKANEPIAIVGSACLSILWRRNSPAKLLESPEKTPKSCFSAKGFYCSFGQYHGHTNVLHSYILCKGMNGTEKKHKDEIHKLHGTVWIEAGVLPAI